jgi:hypothetical protein
MYRNRNKYNIYITYDEEINNTDGTIDYISVRRVMSEIICYGANAQVVLNDCLFGLNHAGIWQDFRDNDFAIINREDISIKDLTYQINENEFVPRASMEITMDILCNATNIDLDYFDTVGYELQFNNDGIGSDGFPIVEVNENLDSSGNNNVFDPLNPVSNITATIGIDDITLISGPYGFSNLGDCIFCSQINTPTPTPTPTVTPSGMPSECITTCGLEGYAYIKT